MALTAPAIGIEKFIDPAAYIVSCETVADRGTVKTVLVTEERADFVTLQNSAGVTFGEISNTGEPYDFTVHVFYLPEGFLAEPLTVRFLNRSKSASKYFTAIGERGVTRLDPERVVRLDREKLKEEYDSHITVLEKRGATLADGIRYEELTCQNKHGAPVLAYALFVGAGKGGFEIGTARNGYRGYEDIETVKGQAEASIAAGKRVVAATNADFFDMFGNNGPAGLCVKDGRAIANPDSMRNFFGMDRNGRAVIDNFVENPALYGQLWSAISGREIILRDGEIDDFSPAEPFSYVCHPRTAAGMDEAGNVVILVVDGRLPERSNGASLVDLARMMQYFGMTRAINLDGGGSSTFLVMREGEMTMLNRPADLERPTEPLIRDIYNSLQITAL